jgi:membrane-associated phospholipid phosphatase
MADPVHDGVHYPGDAVIGSLMGTGAAVAIRCTGRVVARRQWPG